MRIIRVLVLAVALLTMAAAPALADGVTITQEQQRGLSEVNRYRKMVGLAAAGSNSSLVNAARGHAQYMVLANDFGHYETKKDSPYYVAYAPYDRMKKFGYTGSSVSENMLWSTLGAVGTRTYLAADNAVAWWMAAIYHRFPIVSPRTQYAGYSPFYGSGKMGAVLDFGINYSLTGPMTRWPLPNQTGVGTSLSGETPSPVAQFGGSFPVGYPVSITWYKGAVKYTSIYMKRASDGASIDGYRLSPQNDQYHKWSTSLSFIPKKPLALGTKYTVTFNGVFAANGNLSAGTTFSYTWSFTTMPAPGTLVSSTPARNSSGVASSTGVTLNFSQPIRSYTLMRSPQAPLLKGGIGISLRKQSTGTEVGINITAPTSALTKTVALKPAASLEANTAYMLTYNLADAWGRTQFGTVYFTTAAASSTSTSSSITLPSISIPSGLVPVTTNSRP